MLPRKEKNMLKISKIVKHTVVQKSACAKTKSNIGCPDILVKSM